mmetsp:Transcript_2719/g.8407  ORF Transcript_2719/g.8407 Transcript_2719/m.8407 type:complete len:214 (-) Transcript_2719:204-845(-)
MRALARYPSSLSFRFACSRTPSPSSPTLARSPRSFSTRPTPRSPRPRVGSSTDSTPLCSRLHWTRVRVLSASVSSLVRKTAALSRIASFASAGLLLAKTPPTVRGTLFHPPHLRGSRRRSSFSSPGVATRKATRISSSPRRLASFSRKSSIKSRNRPQGVLFFPLFGSQKCFFVVFESLGLSLSSTCVFGVQIILSRERHSPTMGEDVVDTQK